MFTAPFKLAAAALIGALGLALSASPGSAATDFPVVVRADGTLVRADAGVSANRLDKGVYLVKFPFGLDDCAVVATIGTPGDSSIPQRGFVVTTGFSGPMNSAVKVRTFDVNDDPANRPFHLVLSCLGD